MTAPTSSHSFRSIAGVAESAEPASSSSTTANPIATSTPRTSSPADLDAGQEDDDDEDDDDATPTPASEGGLAAARAHAMSAPPTASVSGTTSAANSPHASRNPSPTRKTRGTAALSSALPRPGRLSRKSSTDVSPSRGSTLAGGPSSTVPSAAAIQRALSSANIPQLQPTSSPQELPRTARPAKAASGSNSGENTPRWPISPRLKSPPPTTDARSRSGRDPLRAQPKKPETSTPSIIVQSSSPGPASRLPAKEDAAGNDQEEQAPAAMKVPSRGVSGTTTKLETVQESSQPTTPGLEKSEEQSFTCTTSTAKSSDDERTDAASSSMVSEGSNVRGSKPLSGTGESRTEHAKPSEQRSASTHRPTGPRSKPSISSLSGMRTRSDAPSRNMTVETETVPSVPQSTIGATDRSASGRTDGSVRLRSSNETIRPKKERKMVKRKAPSINASSKADVFEQKVASAVDEAESSDSDATFIYESNPPEHQPHRSRHHSRTPSMGSVASHADPRLAIRDVHKNPGKKSSMKFANSYNNANADQDGDRGDGTIRLGSGRVSGGSHHHHIGRHGQGRGGLGHIAVDSDSSLPQSSRARGPSSRQGSQPNSPRFHTFTVGNGNGSSNGIANGTKKHGEYSTYDIDTENAADDERTPLMATRSPRVRTPRRRNSVTSRQHERRHRRDGGWCRRFAGCLALAILLLVVIFSAVGLIFATTKPLTDVEVRQVRNVVASQEELILDLVVAAVNPNVIGVTVTDMDVIIFAKSKHAGSDRWWREHGNGRPGTEEDWVPIKAAGGVDHGTDPIDDPSVGEPHTMSLGRLFSFASPLNFDGTYFRRRKVESVGELRLSKPGNKTEAGGTARWEEVLEYPFELIVRGTFKYQLPLSTHERKIPVTATYFYDPDAEKKRLKTLEQESRLERNMNFGTHISTQPFGRFLRHTVPSPIHAKSQNGL